MAKEFSRAFYHSQGWKNCRESFIKYKGGLCENCLKRGLYKPGVIVHHVEELTPANIENPEVSLNWNNLRLVCRDCHAEEHDKRKKDRRYTIGENGEVIVDELV